LKIPEPKPKEESRVPTVKANYEFGCIPLELISDLGLEKHWKVKLRSLQEIELILQDPLCF
jgi:hypothetical protein